MKTQSSRSKTQKRKQFTILATSLVLAVSLARAIADCGHCDTGSLFFLSCGGSPCGGCFMASVPPGLGIGKCIFTYVDAYNCNETNWTGPASVRNGDCLADCNCIISEPPHQGTVTMPICTTPDRCDG